MTAKSLFVIGALSLSMATVASAKTYHFTLASPAAVGANELKPGDYDVKVQGSQAVFTDEEHGKSVSVPVTLQHSEKKFADTSVESTDKNGKATIQSITLGGSDTRVVLGQ